MSRFGKSPHFFLILTGCAHFSILYQDLEKANQNSKTFPDFQNSPQTLVSSSPWSPHPSKALSAILLCESAPDYTAIKKETHAQMATCIRKDREDTQNRIYQTDKLHPRSPFFCVEVISSSTLPFLLPVSAVSVVPCPASSLPPDCQRTFGGQK